MGLLSDEYISDECSQSLTQRKPLTFVLNKQMMSFESLRPKEETKHTG